MIEEMAAALGALGDKVSVDAASLAQSKLDRWFFQMYGSAKGQTFDEVWTRTGFINPITLRQGTPASDDQRERCGRGWPAVGGRRRRPGTEGRARRLSPGAGGRGHHRHRRRIRRQAEQAVTRANEKVLI
jgi:hypothetical protein